MTEKSGNLPDTTDIKPDEPFVQFTRSECRECGALQPDWLLSGERRDEHVWDVVHQDETSHSKFYLWTVGRYASQVWKF